jgi:Tfp pilus assembly protein PilO
METKNREKILAIAAAACVALWLLNVLVITPMTNSWHRRSAQIASLRKSIAEGAMLIRRQDAVRGRWDSMRTNALSSNPTVAERQLFTAFDHWVGASGVTEGSFRPQLHETDDNYSTLECRADVTGTPDTIAQFFYNMAKDTIGVKLESCELTSRDDNGRQLALGMDLSGLILPAPNP